MKTNHYIGTFVLSLTEVSPIVAVGNSKKEAKRILEELETLRKQKLNPIVTVDVQSFSFDKVVPIIEEARHLCSRYDFSFVNLLHPKLEGSYDFQESFYKITQLGKLNALELLMGQSEEFIVQYGRWVKAMIQEKLDAVQKVNRENIEFLESKADVVQEATSWKEPTNLTSKQMDLSLLLNSAFNPMEHLFNPHLSLNASPSFQRKLVWTTDKKQDFIDSILKKLPIGIFYINDNIEDLTLGEGYGRLLWDGKQRLHAILSFYKDEFTVNYEGKDLYYSQMKQAFNAAVRQTFVTVMTSKYETLEEIVEAYVMVNAKQVKHTDEDLQQAKDALKNKREKFYSI